ncbi:hypothetical protein AMAG_06817 [Allomyces macrogynus ATCC 38327]|uniref:Uncharacterized protein n=1 Tax=Allomyces macrogynus (strain ATCC 38327) TaxID=578462 RepID=A0A0L0SF43_ALLM3|nr:hypothetical protein AMAG_06817 [Allomyces macrogynus ATCC 38327]|eukprot:KNE61062.1 hypothetical protein AMAG_06817 [Allomyces macrogynus ATCC 38327]
MPRRHPARALHHSGSVAAMRTTPSRLILAVAAAAVLLLAAATPTVHASSHHAPAGARMLRTDAVMTSATSVPAYRKQLTSGSTTTSSGAALSIKFACEKVPDATFCRRAEAAVQRAADRITKEFAFRRPVTVDLGMTVPSCNTTSCAAEAAFLGFASPAQSFPVRVLSDNVTYMYPSALLKQTDLDGLDRVNWPRYDILARFNALYNWYFPDGGATATGAGNATSATGGKNTTTTAAAAAAKQKPYDLEGIALHELCHALGFGIDSQMSLPSFDWGLDVMKVPSTPMLMPFADDTPPGQLATEMTDADLASAPLSPTMYRLARPGIWDRLIVANGSPLSEWTKPIQDAFTRITTGAQAASLRAANGRGFNSLAVVEALLKDSAATAAMSALYHVATSGGANIQIHTSRALLPGKTVVDIESSKDPFAPGVSAAHLAARYNATADFLMIAEDAGMPLAQQIAATVAPPSGIGPATRDVLVALGYTPAGTPFRSIKTLAVISQEAFLDGGSTASVGAGAGAGSGAAAAGGAAAGGGAAVAGSGKTGGVAADGSPVDGASANGAESAVHAGRGVTIAVVLVALVPLLAL